VVTNQSRTGLQTTIAAGVVGKLRRKITMGEEAKPTEIPKM
jgi:hypothetical protein